MTDHSMLILIAGPCRSGTSDDPSAMAANRARLEDVPAPARDELP